MLTFLHEQFKNGYLQVTLPVPYIFFLLCNSFLLLKEDLKKSFPKSELLFFSQDKQIPAGKAKCISETKNSINLP